MRVTPSFADRSVRWEAEASRLSLTFPGRSAPPLRPDSINHSSFLYHLTFISLASCPPPRPSRSSRPSPPLPFWSE
ncbi:hypothetical protein E2C01_055639 [Portunus trituberculatus]|uniref:Uncharacterized protein n=1 Tax=Portunus trituberculatus TaxID=210409 RepID=A0A5B7GW36_PORTR|nr:hypothetical protein [Portunus trituberculatus]